MLKYKKSSALIMEKQNDTVAMEDNIDITLTQNKYHRSMLGNHFFEIETVYSACNILKLYIKKS